MEQAWVNALIGGGLIGLSATIHLLLSGRITGVSGIFFGAMTSKGLERLWRAKFVIGLLLGGVLGSFFFQDPFLNESGRSLAAIIAAGAIVGFGTKLGSGCTSGHGICGISRLSPRSLAATGVFMLFGILTVTLIGLLPGGL